MTSATSGPPARLAHPAVGCIRWRLATLTLKIEHHAFGMQANLTE